MSFHKIDSLELARVKEHLGVDADFTDDDTLIEMYIEASLHYVENYSGKAWAVWSIDEVHEEFLNPIFLDFQLQTKKATINYDIAVGTNDIEVDVYSDNIIKEDAPDDYIGGSVTISFNPTVNEHQKVIATNIRLLLIGDSYTHREDTITGTSVKELPNGVIRMLSTISEGRV